MRLPLTSSSPLPSRRRARVALILGAAGALACLTWSCRTVNDKAADAETLAESRTWYDSAGNGASCDPPATACPSYKDEKSFVDGCVAQGFQAKTCGCSVRCSGKIAVPNTGGAGLVDQTATPEASKSSCSDEAKAYIDKVAASREPGTSLDRCIEDYVCNGNFGWCGESDASTTAHLRALGRGGCEAEVTQSLCKDGSLDSLRCPDADIKKLSKVWADLYSHDLTVKRCIRNYVCNGDKLLCGAADDMSLAQSVKDSVSRSGCDYWLRLFCNIGAKGW